MVIFQGDQWGSLCRPELPGLVLLSFRGLDKGQYPVHHRHPLQSNILQIGVSRTAVVTPKQPAAPGLPPKTPPRARNSGLSAVVLHFPFCNSPKSAKRKCRSLGSPPQGELLAIGRQRDSSPLCHPRLVGPAIAPLRQRLCQGLRV